ncbi:MAG: LysR family transcriptional regulator ArgP [Colwellia sp.]|nr:LysR family transcriptional regulator ArgP [Colwellia sp.]
MKFDYKLLEALNAVVEEQGFDNAAQKLFITQSAVSQRIKALEENIGQPVIIRGQPIKKTMAGEKLLSHFKMVEQLENELLPELLPDMPKQPIRITLAINADSIATWFFDAMAPLLKNYLIELNILIENEQDTVSKLRSGEAIGAVSKQSTPLPGYQSSKLGQLKYILVASKEFRHRYFSDGVTTQSLKMAPGISYDSKDDMHEHFITKHFNLAASEYYCHNVRSSEAFVNLTKRGLAYSLISELQIKDELINGQLINLCPDKVLIENLYWHSWVLVKGVNKKISEEIISSAQNLLS